MAFGTDLRDFYYGFAASSQRAVRNCLQELLTLEEAKQFSCYRKELDKERCTFPALSTLAMGDACAVEIVQISHVGLLVQTGFLREENIVALHLPCPRTPSMVGIVIDNLVSFEVLSRSHPSVSRPFRCKRCWKSRRSWPRSCYLS